MRRRQRAPRTESGIRREQVIGAGLELVSRHGLKGLTVAALAAEVGVVPSAIYRHFRGKSDITDAMLDFLGERLLDMVGGVCKDTSDAEERLRLLHIRHVRMIRENRGILRLVFSGNIHEEDPARKGRLFKVVRSYRARIEEIVAEGQTAGTLYRGMSPQAVSLMFLGLIQPAAFLWSIGQDDFDVTFETERCWRLFRRAIGPDGDGSSDTERRSVDVEVIMDSPCTRGAG